MHTHAGALLTNALIAIGLLISCGGALLAHGRRAIFPIIVSTILVALLIAVEQDDRDRMFWEFNTIEQRWIMLTGLVFIHILVLLHINKPHLEFIPTRLKVITLACTFSLGLNYLFEHF